MTQPAFGTWAGTTMNDTSIIVATGFSYGTVAGAVATITKLTRTLLLLPLVLVIAGGIAASERGSTGSWAAARKAIPWFVLGFVALAAAHSFQILSPASYDVAASSQAS